MKSLVVYGCGAVGRLAKQIVDEINVQDSTWELLGFLDDNPVLHGQPRIGLTVLGGMDWLVAHPECAVVVAVAKPATRRKIALAIEDLGQREFATLVHPTAWMGSRSTVGAGSIIYPGAMIDPDVRVGCHAILNKACTVGHDTVLGDYVTAAPGANIGGRNLIGEGCDIGIGCATIQGVRIGEWSVVGAGAVVIRDLPSNTTAVGVPASPIKLRPAGWYKV